MNLNLNPDIDPNIILRFAHNDCCGNYSLTDKALARLNEIRNKKNKPIISNECDSLGKDDYNSRCELLCDDEDFVSVVEEFNGNVLEYCNLKIIDITNEHDLHELFYQKRFNEITFILSSRYCELNNLSDMDSSDTDSSDTDSSDTDSSDDWNLSPTSKYYSSSVISMSKINESDITPILSSEDYPLILNEKFEPINR
jgi:hypothetical protein